MQTTEETATPAANGVQQTEESRSANGSQPKILDTKISFFDGARNPEPKREVTVGEVLVAIRDGGKKTHPLIERIRRSAWDKAGIAQLKERLPAVTFSGTFTRRANDALIQH